MKVLTYQIQLLEPILLTGLEGDPNSSISLTYIAGSVLRGALIGLYTSNRKNRQLNLQNKTDTRLFLDGTTHFLNGYVMKKHHRQWLPSVPAPLSWQKPKRPDYPTDLALCAQSAQQAQPLLDFAVKSANPVQATTPIPEYKPIKASYCLVAETRVHLTNPSRQVYVQTARNRDYGRARTSTTDNTPAGAVYQYESLQAGQLFRAHILCESGDVATLAPLLDQTLAIGGARSNGYGRVQLSYVGESDATTWSEIDQIQLVEETFDDPFAEDEYSDNTPTNDLPNGRVVVTLLSDMVLRDKDGHFTLDAAYLGQALGLEQAPSDLYVGFRSHGGFNRKWGLPLPQMVAWQMGSVFVFDAVSTAQIDRLQQIRAVGERQIDGFGRIAINWQVKATLDTFPSLKPAKPNPVTFGNDSSRTIAAAMVKRNYHKQLNDRLNAAVNITSRSCKATQRLSKSQLYRLRMMLQTALHTLSAGQSADLAAERQKLTAYLADLDKRSSTHRQFRRARIGDKALLDWMQTTVTATTLQFESDKPPQLGSDVIAVTDDSRLILEYNLRYADGVLADIAKLKQEAN